MTPISDTARRRLALEPLVLGDQDLERIAEVAAAKEALDEVRAELPDADWDLRRARVIDEEPSRPRRATGGAPRSIHLRCYGRPDTASAVARNRSVAAR